MNFRTLTAFQVAALEKPKGKGRATPKGGAKRTRSHNLACYVPPGDQQSSRRVTGTHLDPDGHDMEAAAMSFAAGLIEATTKPGAGTVRNLVGPARYGDKVLAKYCQALFKGALGKPSETLEHPISPALVPYLLGGVTWTQIEQVGHRAMELLDFYPDPLGVPTLHRAVSNVGFGQHIRHDHIEAADLAAGERANYNHLSQRQAYLLNLPVGGYATVLIRDGAYNDGLRRQLAAWKPVIMAQAERELDPDGGEMSAMAGAERVRVVATDLHFVKAVNMVFRGDWDQLDLKAGGQENAEADLVTLMARKIIHKLSYNDKVTAEQLIGMSLLTGISVANWTNFALEDWERRGETFVTEHEVERLIAMVEVHAGFDCEPELRTALMALHFPKERMYFKYKFARRLQSARNPLWSRNGLYYLQRFDEDGLPICKPKPFEVSRQDVD